MTDTKGVHIKARGGGIVFNNGLYFGTQNLKLMIVL